MGRSSEEYAGIHTSTRLQRVSSFIQVSLAVSIYEGKSLFFEYNLFPYIIFYVPYVWFEVGFVFAKKAGMYDAYGRKQKETIELVGVP